MNAVCRCQAIAWGDRSGGELPAACSPGHSPASARFGGLPCQIDVLGALGHSAGETCGLVDRIRYFRRIPFVKTFPWMILWIGLPVSSRARANS